LQATIINAAHKNAMVDLTFIINIIFCKFSRKRLATIPHIRFNK
jgi:hypothetical protein